MTGAPARWTAATFAAAVCAALSGTAPGGCAGTERPAPSAHEPAQAGATAAAPKARPPAAPAADTIAILAGSVELGSLPGTPSRNPSAEADLVSVQLPGFSIDRLPYPNDPAQPARTGVDRDEATALCAQRGKRLCSEVEWERACKGDDNAPYPSGMKLDLAACRRDRIACATQEGVLELGTALREWTASSVPAGLGHPLRTAVLRGAGPEAAVAQHRCGARSGATPDTKADDVGFRCCSGPAPAVTYPIEPARELTKPLAFDRAALRSALAAVPALAKLADSFEPFSDADVSAALRRGGQSRESLRLWTFMPAAFAWSPVPGEELWVLTGRTSDGALLAVLYPLPNGRFAHAGSTVIAEPDTSVAVGASEQYPNQLTWTTCYSCPGEGGTIRFTDDARVELAYR